MNKFNNANMWQKSAIQIMLEQVDLLERFEKSLNAITEQYTVKGNVFGLIGNKPSEIESGYFVIESETDDLHDAIKEMKSMDYCIRINEDKYQIGRVYAGYSECDETKTIIDIENQVEC